VLAHELAHLKRRDLIWGWLPEVARLVYWFHPVAHWTVRQVRLERELACDQVVMVALGHSAPAYAETLVRVVSLFSSPARLSNTVAGLHGEAVSSCGGLDSKEVRP
jgi:beta-lactamase regulating signal transducer with metallopeptidase domain